MADYKITSELGKEFAKALNAGSSGTASDGSVWTKNADGTITVQKDGQTLNGVVSSAPSSAPAASTTKKTASAVVKPSTLNQYNTSTLVSDTGGGLTRMTQKQAQVAQQQAEKKASQKIGLNALATSAAQLGTAGTKQNTQTLFEQAITPTKEQSRQVLTDFTNSVVNPAIQRNVLADVQEKAEQDAKRNQEIRDRIALQQAQEEAINAEATATMNQIGKYRAMPTLAETVAKSFAGGAIDSTRGFINNLGYAAQGAVRDQLSQQIGDAVMRGDYAEAERLRETLNGFSETKDIATFGQTYDRQLATRRQNENGLYKVVNDVSAGVGGMVPSILASFATQGIAGTAGAASAVAQAAANTASLFVMSSGAAGNATREALNAGASNENAIIYGGAVGAVEALTEKMFGGISFLGNKVFGAGVTDDLVETAIKKAVQDKTAQAAVLFLADALGEGVEEFTSEYADWFLNKWLVKSDNRQALEVLGDAGYSFLVGALTAAAMNTASAISGKSVHQIAQTVTQETERVLDAEIENVKPVNQAILSTIQGQQMQEQAQQTQETAADRAILDTIRQQNTEKNTAPIAEADSTVVNDNPDVHTEQEQRIIEEYKNAVNEDIAKFYTDAQSGEGQQFFPLKPVSTQQAEDIKNAIGVDTTGFSTRFEDRQAKHINDRHGENGKQDKSMRDVSDIARIQYVIDNYDRIEDGGTTEAYLEFRDGKNRLARTVLLSKKVNGTYYVVEAAPITKAKSLYIVSAYISKRGASHSVDTENLSRRNGATVSELAPTDNVAQMNRPVNAEDSAGAAESGANAPAYQSPIYGNSVGAATPKVGPFVESQTKALTENRFASEEERNATPLYVHERISNALQMERAMGQLLADTSGNIVYFDEQVQDLLEKERWDNLDRDVAQLLKEEAWNRNDLDKWRDLEDKIADTDTEAGKTLQGTQKWIDRENPVQAVVRAAEKALQTASDKIDKQAVDKFIVDTGKRIDAIDRKRTMQAEQRIKEYGNILLDIAKQRKMLTPERYVKIAVKQGKNDINWLRSMVYNGLYNVGSDYAKPADMIDSANKGLRRVRSYVITNQLFRLTTNIANVVSNIASNMTESAANVQAVANIADLAMSASTGARTHGYEKTFGKTARKTASNFAQKSIAEIWLDTSTESTDSKYQQTNGRSVREYKMTENKLFSVVDAVLGTALNTTDAFSTGLSQGAVEQSLKRRVENAQITAQEAADVAEQRGLDTTFHNKTILGNALTKMSKAANAGMEYGLGNIVIGNYLNVPAAIVGREASKIPTIGTIGALANMAVVITDSEINKHNGAKANSDVGKYGQFGSVLNKMSGDDLTITQRQARAAQEFGRAIGGGAIEIGAFVFAAMRGWVKRFDDEDKDKAAYDAAMGNQGLMINWSAIVRDLKGESTEWRAGDIRWSLGRLEPLVINMNLGLDVAEILKNDESISVKDASKLSIDALEAGIADLSMIQNLQAIFDALKYKDEDESAGVAIGKAIAENNVTSLTPGLVQQAAKASDPYYRDLYTGETWGQQVADAWKSTIPVLRQTLPVKLTGEGTPKEYAGTRGEQIVNSLITPYSQTTQKEDARGDFYEKYDVLPARNAISSVTIGGEKIALNSEQKRTYQENFGRYYTALVDKLQETAAFKTMPDEVKKIAAENAKSLASAWGKESLDIGYSSSDWKDTSPDFTKNAIKKIVSKTLNSANAETGYLPAKQQKEYDSVVSQIKTVIRRDSPKELLDLASEKANKYYLDLAKHRYGADLTSDETKIADYSKEELADYFAQEAMKDYWKENPITETDDYKSEVQKFSNAVFTGVSDELKEKASAKAADYFKQLELSKYGKKPDAWVLEAQRMRDSDRTGYFIEKAAESAIENSNDDESKWLTARRLYSEGDINDNVVLAVLNEKTVDAYERYGKDVGVTSKQLLDATQFYNSRACEEVKNADGQTVRSREENFDKWLDSQTGWTAEQKKMVRRCFYDDHVADYKFFAEEFRNGRMSLSEAKSNLKPGYQAGWSNTVSKTGASIADYLDACSVFEGAPSDDERKASGFNTKWEWFVAQLNETELTKEQKYAIAISMDDYAESTQQKIYNRLK